MSNTEIFAELESFYENLPESYNAIHLSYVLVTLNAYRKEQGMLNSVACGKRCGPNLMDYTTACLLALQAVEKGAILEPTTELNIWSLRWNSNSELQTKVIGPLGIIAAKALIEFAESDAGEIKS